MKTGEGFLRITFSIIIVLLIALIVVDYINHDTQLPIVVVSVLAVAFVLLSPFLNYLSHKEQIRISCRVKQLEELYYPLKTALDYNHKIDIGRLEKYSYLATGKLEPLIVSFIKTQKSLGGNSNPLDNVVSKAIEHDILEIQKDLKDHLRIKEPMPKSCP